MLKKRNWLTGLFLGCCLILAGSVAAVAAEPEAAAGGEPAYAARGADSCMRCHDSGSPVNILKTEHGVKGDARTPFAQHFCESCHGPSADHMSSPAGADGKRVSPAVVFKGPKKSPAAVINSTCLGCHEGGLRMNWRGSQHYNSDVACVDCHTMHTTTDPMLTKKAQPEVCFKCHAEQRADSAQYSHHPIREGKVVCSDCHNPHGSAGPKLLKEVRVTDVCFNCHAEKRGPYLWEHQPVVEDCTNCHNPHGSQNARLLKEKLPFLCMDCHTNTDDMGGNAVSRSTSPNHGSFLYTSGDRACVNCHSQIHGSNSPSGSSFFR